MITMAKAIPMKEMVANKINVKLNEPPNLFPVFKNYDRIAAISIGSPNDYTIFEEETEWIKIFRFDDTSPSGAFHFPNFGGSQFMTSKQANEIVNFVFMLHALNEKIYLIVNCAAGICRSGAVAKFALDICCIDNDLFWVHNDKIQPNLWVYNKLYEAMILGKQGE